MLSSITPVILTFNEAPTLERTLAKLSWATQVVVVDSHSTDDTAKIAARHANVRFLARRFDTHANQWNFAISQTAIATDWILSLDADYVLTDALIDELRKLEPPGDIAGYFAAFEYCIGGRPLRGSVYPPAIVLFRKGCGRYAQDGHTQRLELRGNASNLVNRIQHDDRKPMSRWLRSQDRYMELEADKLTAMSLKNLAWPDRIRRFLVLAPALMFIYTLFVRGTIWDGRAGMFYAVQRTVAELILSVRLFQRYLGYKRA